MNTATKRQFRLQQNEWHLDHRLVCNAIGTALHTVSQHDIVWPLNIQTFCKLHRHIALPNDVLSYVRMSQWTHLTLAHTVAQILFTCSASLLKPVLKNAFSLVFTGQTVYESYYDAQHVLCDELSLRQLSQKYWGTGIVARTRATK